MKKVDHIGIAVQSIDESLAFYTNVLGFQCIGVEEVVSQQVKVAFLDACNIKLELLESLDHNGPIAKFIERRGEGIHHVALGVDSIEKRIAELKEKGIQMIDDTPRTGAAQTRIAFMHPRSAHGVLFELSEKRHVEEK
ncbi:methylmalonyl-CoA epimerase [Siminovitchia sediminis]|uniref:Methylmalonyl-CoA epimerase n=1 Tax=Siminovitchia sediminis TaxID=1274353 RepID=A0ABW4KG49_9BACI